MSRKPLSLTVAALCLLAACTTTPDQKKSYHQVMWSRECGPAASGHFRSLSVADFNNDGNLDLAAGVSLPTPGSISVWMGDGRGNWLEYCWVAVKGDIRSIAAGDIDNDGLTDLVFSSWGDTNGVRVYLNKGENRWEEGEPPTTKGHYEGIALVDVDKDGHLDVVAADSTSDIEGGIEIWINDGKGHWREEVGPVRSGTFRDVVGTDLNHDGYPDIAGSGWGPYGAICVWLGSRTTNWQNVFKTEKGDYWGIGAADLDLDGNLDLVACCYHGGLEIWYGDGTGRFTRSDALASEKGRFWDLVLKDMDRDGRVDIVATSFGNSGVRLWMNKGSDRWEAVTGWLPERYTYYQPVIGDFNGDQKPDIAAAHYSEGIHVWLQGVSGPKPPGVKAPEEPKKRAEESEKEVETREEVFTVYFDSGKADIRMEAVSALENAVEILKANEGATAVLEGNADLRDIHTKEFPDNRVLSEARARSAKQYLLDRGIAEERLTTTAFGNGRPVAEGKTDKELRLNRRADIRITIPVVLEKPVAEAVKVKRAAAAMGLESLRAVIKNQVFSEEAGFPEYIIGVGDSLEISLWEGIQELKTRVRIKADGTISFTYLKDIHVSGLTPSMLEKLVSEKLKGLVRDPRVDVRVVEYRSKKASIFGEVQPLPRQPTGPGTYMLYGKEYILDFLSRVGGPTKSADLKEVEFIRQGRTYKVNLYKALFEADLSQNIVLDHGDVVFIPSTRDVTAKVYIFGEVRKPGVIPFKAKLNILDAVARAGGFTDFAVRNSTKVIRGDITRPEVLSSDMKKLMEKGDPTQNIILANNDIVFVPRTFIGDLNHFVRQIQPIWTMLFWPAAIRDAYFEKTTSLRFDIGAAYGVD